MQQPPTVLAEDSSLPRLAATSSGARWQKREATRFCVAANLETCLSSVLTMKLRLLCLTIVLLLPLTELVAAPMVPPFPGRGILRSFLSNLSAERVCA